jgi:hypothetical protein
MVKPTYVDLVALIPEPLPPSVLCNCYAYVKQTYAPTLPSTATILSSLSATGSVAVFYYADIGLHHFAWVVREEADAYLVDEANYESCQRSQRRVPKNDVSLLGFFDV